jgi:hypothetical protein
VERIAQALQMAGRLSGSEVEGHWRAYLVTA